MLKYLACAPIYDRGSKCFEFSKPSLPALILSNIRSG